MTYAWIDIAAASAIKDRNVILFGAGKGSEEYVHYCREAHPGNRILCVVDNDRSFWGKQFMGIDIVPPDRMADFAFDTIIVTSVSGRESIAYQLRVMGYAPSKDFILIGRYPGFNDANLRLILDLLPPDIKGKRFLHVGPGGFLGLEVLLHSLGAAQVCAIDKYGFGIHYPDISGVYDGYARLAPVLSSVCGDSDLRSIALERFDRVFKKIKGGIAIDSDNISYHCPMDLCRLDLPDDRFDCVVSFAVLEHVTHPECAVGEIARVLKPGGFSLHRIVTQDHRSFSNIDGYTPFSFRTHGKDEWEETIGDSFYQNRWLPVEWKAVFEKKGMHTVKFFIEKSVEIDEPTFQRFHPDFQKFTKNELQQVNLTILCQK